MEYSDMQLVKRRFFAMRNGIVADALRHTGHTYRMIFGLNLPQIAEIAQSAPHTAEFARQLWDDVRTRESLLLAPMLFPREEMTETEAREWMESVTHTEVADILCHRLLRHMPFAPSLISAYLQSDSDMLRYTSLRLMRNLLPACAAEADSAARRELARSCALTKPLCLNILDETEFLLNEN
ncbi:MAG: DNA alkylation repair protein [Muribaculaceae bacterium]|nr:DNA alkylation repair protein [Muribaculaceae bacterium]